MGVITDFFDINTSSPEVLLEHDDPWNEFKCLQCKGIDPVKLSTLLEIIGHGSYDENFEMISPINPESETGPWVIPISSSIVSAIAAVKEEILVEVASKWCQTDELKMDRWSVPETHLFLKDMVDFFKNSQGQIVQFISV